MSITRHTEKEDDGHLRKFLSGAMFSTSTMAASAILTLLTGVIFARWLKPEGFGAYSLILSVVSFGASVGAAGMDSTVARYVCFYLGNRNRGLIRTVIGYGVRWGSVFSAAVALAAFGLLHSGGFAGTKLSGIAPFAWCILLTIPALAAQGVLLQAVLALQAVKTRVILEKIAQPLFRLALPFALLSLFRERTMAAVAGIMASSLFLIPMAGMALGRHLAAVPPGHKAPREARKEWRRFAIPYVLFSLQNFVSGGMGIDILLVSALASVRDSGIYAACFRFTLGLTLARAGMDYAFGPRVGQLFGESDFAPIRNLYRASFAIGLAWTLPLSVVLISFSRPLMTTFFGAAYAKGAGALTVLVLGFAVDGSAGCYTTLLAMIGRPWLILANGLVGGVMAVGLCFLLIPSYGMIGAAVAVSAARCAATVLGTFEIWRIHRFHPFSRPLLKLLLPGVCIGIVGYFLRRGVFSGFLPPSNSNLVLLVGLVLATYLMALRLTRFSLRLS
jgi:O-antigen/teichoic acid export membrane protein